MILHILLTIGLAMAVLVGLCAIAACVVGGRAERAREAAGLASSIARATGQPEARPLVVRPRAAAAARHPRPARLAARH